MSKKAARKHQQLVASSQLWKLDKKWAIILLGAALLAGLWLYLPPYRDAFIGDDYVQLNRISSFLERPWESWQIIFPNWQAWYYRPLQNYVFLVNRLWFGLNPFGHYVGLILWHLLAIALVYQLGRRLKLERPIATAVALLFGFHGHYFDVVTWLSAVAIVAAAALSALAAILFTRYLNRPDQKRSLAAMLIVFCAGLLTHEEAFLLPPKLFLLWLLYPRAGGSGANWHTNWRRWIAEKWLEARAYPWFLAAWGLMGLLMVGYLTIQWVRPNLNVNLQGGAALGINEFFNLAPISRYLVQVAARTTATFDGILTTNSNLAAGVLLLLLMLWFWRANWLGRFGLLWWAMHLIFIYAALWVQRPEFLGGRHLYNGNIGLALSIGAAVSQLLHSNRTILWRRQDLPFWRYGLPLLLTAVLLMQAVTLKEKQQIWLGIAEKDRQAEASLKAIIPELTTQTRIFAHRFALDVSYMEGVVKAWYNQPNLQGFSGRLSSLPQWGWLPDSIYLLDYANNRVVNLMPELQSAGRGRYLLLWAGGSQQLTVAGPPEDQRLAVAPPIPEEANIWQPLTYQLNLNDDVLLHLAAGHGFNDGPAVPVWYRIRLTSDNVNYTLYEDIAMPGQWQTHTFDLGGYAPGEIIIRLEIAYADERPSAFYWANPHLSR